jgi:flagellar hook-associated protein 3 FlgL
MMVDRVLNNLSMQTRRILSLQDQLATGLRVTTPSDDPIAARRGVNTRMLIGKNEQYLSNIAAAGPPLNETVTTLETVNEVVNRVYELTLQGANGTMGDEELGLIAEEVNQLLESMLQHANHRTNDRYVFGGTRTLQEPFAATRDADGMITGVTYQGNDEHMEVAISDSATVVVNETGADAFLANEDIFAVLIGIRDDMMAGDQTSLQQVRLVQIEGVQEQTMASMARVGSLQNRLERTSVDTEDFNFQLQELMSDTLDADFAEVIVNLNSQNNTFQAALNAAGQVIQPSLLDFIR